MMVKKRKRSFIKLFNNPKNVKKAIFLLNSGYSYRIISKRLGCDKSAVIAFYKRKLKEGVEFKIYRKKVKIKEEKLNTGKTYADYLAEDDAKNAKLRAKNMRKAEKTIRKLNENREKNVKEEEHWYF